MKQWYTLHTKANAEYLVQLILQQRSIETYLPEALSRKQYQVERVVPFFPTYLFMFVDLDQTNSTLWQWVPGLRNVVSVDASPSPISHRVIDAIQANLAQFNADSTAQAPRFDQGETIKIIDGPFSGMFGIFERRLSGEQRVQVLLDFLGQLNRLNVNAEAVEKAPAGSHVPYTKRPRRSRGRGRSITRN